MADNDLWFEPVKLLSRCSLNEGLLWVWGDRVPVDNIYREKNVFESLADWECTRLKISPAPSGIGRGVQFQTEERLRRGPFAKMPKDSKEFLIAKALEEADEARRWILEIATSIELPATELFLKLRRGELESSGKVLPDGASIVEFLEEQNSYSGSRFEDLVDVPIPSEAWTVPGIDWIANALSSRGVCYCDVSLPVDPLMSLFAGHPLPIEGARLVGDCVTFTELEDSHIPPRRRPLGRPTTFAWDAFHVEVANLIKNNLLPQKKEAAIQQMLSWFAATQGGQVPSRSAVSDKLTPYYRKFFAN